MKVTFIILYIIIFIIIMYYYNVHKISDRYLKSLLCTKGWFVNEWRWMYQIIKESHAQLVWGRKEDEGPEHCAFVHRLPLSLCDPVTVEHINHLRPTLVISDWWIICYATVYAGYLTVTRSVKPVIKKVADERDVMCRHARSQSQRGMSPWNEWAVSI